MISIAVTKVRTLFEVKRGQGLTSTKWNGLNFFITLNFGCVYCN